MEFGVNLHHEGVFHGLPQYEPSLLASADGHRVSLVATVEVRDHSSGQGHLCRGLLTGQRFRLRANVPTGVHKVTILGGQVNHVRGPIVSIDGDARVLCHQQKDLSCLFQMIETCAGMGGLGKGATYAGWKTCVFNDMNPKFCKHMENLGEQVVLGDISLLSTVFRLHEAAPTAGSISFGYSCQPFSRAGDGKEGHDQRAQSLPFGLYCAYLLQLDLVVTECVPEASVSPFVLRCLNHYMQMTNSDRSEAVLDLAQIWPAHRRRWWTVLMKSYMGKVYIPPFPKLPMEPTIACLMPRLMTMTQLELQDLILSVDERKKFEQFGKGLGAHMINFMQILATALHSWGNQCVDCACGCRGPLSLHRLQSRGLFGVLAHVPNQDPDKNVRHLSGREMALLNGYPKEEGWTDQPRLLTAGMGQLASPLQSAWVFAAIYNHLVDHGFCKGDQIPPKQILACVAMDLFKLRDQWFDHERTVTMDVFQEVWEGFLEDPPPVAHPSEDFHDLTTSQEADLTAAIEQIEANQETGLSSEPSPMPSVPITDDLAPGAKVAPGVGPIIPGPASEKMENSQRPGRKNPEEKMSGMTHNQPATGALGPVEQRINQPAWGPQEPPVGEVTPPTLFHAKPPVPPVGPTYVSPTETSAMPHATQPDNHPSVELMSNQIVHDLTPPQVHEHSTLSNLGDVQGSELSVVQSSVPSLPSNLSGKFAQSVLLAEVAQDPGVGSNDSVGSSLRTIHIPEVQRESHQREQEECKSRDDFGSPPTHFQAMPLDHPVGPSYVTPGFGFDANTSGVQMTGMSFQTQHPVNLKIAQSHVVERSPPDTPMQGPNVGNVSDVPVGSTSHDQQTGALLAFSTSRPTENLLGGSNIPVDLGPPKNFPAQDRFQGVLVYDVDADQVFHHSSSPGQTVGTWKSAMQSIGLTWKYVFTMFGQSVKDPESLDQLRCLLVTNNPLPCHQLTLTQLERLLSTIPAVKAVLHQGGSMSVHEFQYYMTSLESFGLAKPLKPLIMECFCDSISTASHWLASCPQEELVATAFLWNHHWIPVLVRRSETTRFTTTSEGAQVLQVLFRPGSFVVDVRPTFHSTFHNDCGFQAIAWIIAHASILEGQSLSTYDAIKWRSLYWQHVSASQPKLMFHLGGHSDVEIAVQALLKEHGVPIDKLQERSSLVLRQIGVSAVQGVFQAPRPWQALKALANAQKPMLRLITHEELQAIIASKTKTGHPVGSKHNKKKAGTGTPVQVSPAEIQLPTGIFCQANGEPLAQIQDRQFGSNAKGMVLISEAEYRPFQTQGCMSDQGLGFLVLSPFSQELATQGQIIRFPVQSLLTGEPILMSAVLIQKGRLEVRRSTPTKPQAIEQVDTQTVKMLLFRDQVPLSWDTVCQQPVRVDQPVLDVWQRDFVNLFFRKSKPQDAAMFVVHMRLAKDAFLHCFKLSGTKGVFVEPRSPDGKSQDPQFQTVWLQKQTLAEAKALQAVVPAQSSLLRVNQRYGLKVSIEDAPHVHAKVKPDEPYMSGSCQTFKAGPMPWGTTKKAMQALLIQWGWKAKVLHSAGKAVDGSGLMWLVSSSTNPPCTAYQLAHGDVIIHQESSGVSQTWQPPRVQVPASLLKMKTGTDPLQDAGDPWAAAAQALPSSKMNDTVHAKLASFEAALDQKMQDRLQQSLPDDVPMVPDHEPRLAAMEKQIAQLQAHSGSLDQKVDQIQRQVEMQSANFSNALDSKLSEQMAKIEALMNKRSRTE
eukprot:s1144_g16.t1